MIKWFQNASRTTIALTAIAMAIVLFLCINLIASLTIIGTRLDVTEQRLFTLTDQTRATLEAIEEPITLRLYLSSALVNADPRIRLHSERVIEMLKTYELVSGGMIDFQQVDPVSLSVEEDEALGLGIAPLQLSINDRAYFGLVATNTLDNIEIIPYLAPDETAALEYDLTRIVSRIAAIDLPVVGVISGLSLAPDGGGPASFFNRISQEFIVEELPVDINAIPPFVDVLVVIHPYVLFHPTRYAIEQYVMRGGRVLLLLDNLAEMGPPAPANPAVLQYPESRFIPLLETWGVDMVEDLVVGDPALAVTVQSPDGRQFPYLEVFRANTFNPDDVVTAPLSSILFVSPAAIAPRDDATTEFTPLVMTTGNAGFIPQGVAMQRNPPASQQAFVPAGEQVLAARITGTIRTAYPDGPPQQAEGVETAPPELIAESPESVDIIVVADTDFIADDYFDGQRAGRSNADFAVNAIEQLAGATNLTALRGRQAENRPFTRIEEMLNNANREYGDDIQALTDRYNELGLQIEDLLSRTPLGQPAGLSPELRAQYDEMIAEQLAVQRERRDLQALVRAEFEELRTRITWLNILVIPGVVIVFGLLVALWRRVRLSRYLARRQATA